MQRKPRQRWLMRFMVMGVMAVAVGMASLVQAQTTSTGPYYATPSWDQTLPSATRFIILSNFSGQAVLDRTTGLVWARGTEGVGDWSAGRVRCLGKKLGGQMGWRLPSVVELSSLVDPTALRSAEGLPPGHPFSINGTQQNYWSATTNVLNSTEVWVVNFADATVGTRSTVAPDTFQVWCVRSSMNADAY